MIESRTPLSQVESTHPFWDRCFDQVGLGLRVSGLVLVIMSAGLGDDAISRRGLIQGLLALLLMVPLLLLGVRFRWSRVRQSFLTEQRITGVLQLLWLAGGLVLLLLVLWQAGEVDVTNGEPVADSSVWPHPWLVRWNNGLALLIGIAAVVEVMRRTSNAGLHAAVLFVGSFVGLISAGSLLLMLPWARPEGEPSAPWNVALFTSTSACCVTGLTVVDTATYWSRTGQIIIMGLIQAGGLGILTFGAFFAMAFGKGVPAREQATFRDMLDSERLGDVGSVLKAMIGFTIGIELIGAGLLSTLWPELPWTERVYYGLFHSVSAFCNAGFALRSESLLGWELRWQVAFVIPALIICGGFGFVTMDGLRALVVQRLRWMVGRRRQEERKIRLSLSTRLVAWTTLWLLLVGTLVLMLTEWNNPHFPKGWQNQFANAWFHSVTLRTAGFNTVDHALITPVGKLIGVIWMFVGASPGSTGGGVKTTSLALVILTIRAVMRDRPRVEAFGRTIPNQIVFKSIAVVALALVALLTGTALLMVFEDRPAYALDYLYEAASALGTVGVSAGITTTLSIPSQMVDVALMFFGRVGPLTIVVALAVRSGGKQGGFEYPEERVTLG